MHDSQPHDEPLIPGRWSQQRRDLATVAWVSFLTAALGSVPVFALVDPVELSQVWHLAWEPSRVSGYVAIFIALWLLTFVAARCTVFMIRTGPRRGHARGVDGGSIPRSHDPKQNNPDLDTDDWL